MRPSSEILAAFGVDGTPERLSGGRGRAWKVGGSVLKPLDVLPEELGWLDQVARGRDTAGSIRLSLPIRSRSNQLVVDGWSALPFLDGKHLPGRWVEIANIARQFAALFADVRRPAFIDMRAHAWAQADRFAWGDESGWAGVGPPGAAPHVAELLKARRRVSASACLVHGDLAGNVLFHATQAPAVIDLTLYWRPTEYSVAVIAVDAVCFENAPLSVLETISSDDCFPQYLVRALLFRIMTDWLNRAPVNTYAAYNAAVDRVLELAGARSSRNVRGAGRPRQNIVL